MVESARFGSKAHRDFIKDYRRQQKIYTPEQCIQELIDFMKKVVKGEPIAEKIAMESIIRCDSREGMLTNRRFFKDYLEETTGEPRGNPGHNPGPRFKDKGMDRIYQGLVGKTPDQLLDMKIFGSIHALFEMGYEGKPLPRYCPRGTAAYAAYVAGKESGAGNPGHNPGKTVAEILSGRTDYRAKQQTEMLAKDKLSMDNFDMTYEQLPDVRKSLVDLAYLRDLKAGNPGHNPGDYGAVLWNDELFPVKKAGQHSDVVYSLEPTTQRIVSKLKSGEAGYITFNYKQPGEMLVQADESLIGSDVMDKLHVLAAKEGQTSIVFTPSMGPLKYGKRILVLE